MRHLKSFNVEIVLYTNGDSRIDVEKRYLFAHAEWPLDDQLDKELKELHHVGWAVKDASRDCDVIHMNSPAAVTVSLFTEQPIVCTIHHPHAKPLRDHYLRNSSIAYVTLSEFQRRLEAPLKPTTIYHGLDFNSYRLVSAKQEYVCWLGRISPLKGTHLAIDFARATGVPLKIGGDVQPVFERYWRTQIKPRIDGKFIQYLGELNLEQKNELLGNASAFLFPIDWEEPFGLVMLEAMACGTPVLAFRRGAVEELVENGISGFSCDSIAEMPALWEQAKRLEPAQIRAFAEKRFSAVRMATQYAQLYERVLVRYENSSVASRSK